MSIQNGYAFVWLDALYFCSKKSGHAGPVGVLAIKIAVYTIEFRELLKSKLATHSHPALLKLGTNKASAYAAAAK